MQAQKLSLVRSRVSSMPSKMCVKDLASPLRVLLLSGCHDLTTLDGAFISHFTNLNVLDVSMALNIRSLRELVVLNVQSLGIESLPQ